jgi:RNA recognition motif-containing protein
MKKTKKPQKKKAKFANKYSRNWIYVTGLPTSNDVTEAEIASVFSKAGLLDLDPLTQLPKIKLYRHPPVTNHTGISATSTTNHDIGSSDTMTSANTGSSMTSSLKGDASICYARPESVALAITLLDDTPFRYDQRLPPDQQLKMTVQAAKFVPRPTTNHEEEEEEENDTTSRSTSAITKPHPIPLSRPSYISNTQRRVAKLATKQAMDWDEDGNYNHGRITGGKKGLCIIVLKHTFDLHQISSSTPPAEEEDVYWETLEQALRTECEQFGTVEKITFCTSHPDGITIVKFVQPLAASDAIQRFNRQSFQNRQLIAFFWDGVTDYTSKKDDVQEEEEMAKREEEFGDWLETQELPAELQLQTYEDA